MHASVFIMLHDGAQKGNVPTGTVSLHDVHYVRLRRAFSHSIMVVHVIDALTKAKGKIDFWEHFRPRT